MVRHDIPDAISSAGANIERFDFRRGDDDELVAYVGKKEALVKGKIVTETFFPDDSTAEGAAENIVQESVENDPYNNVVLAELERASDGLWIYRKFPRRAAVSRKDKAEKELSDHTSPKQWLESVEDALCGTLRCLLSEKIGTIHTKSGFRYTWNAVRVNEILNNIESALQDLRNVPVRVQQLRDIETGSSDGNREALADAEIDSRFQRFMQTAMLKPQEPDGDRHA